MKTLIDKRILITGAAGGLGLATARAFASAGARLLLTDVDAAAAEGAAEQLRADDFRASAFAMDVTSERSVRAVRELILDDHGPIDVLVNNAGIVFGGEFLNVPLRRHLKTYAVNTHGPVIVTHVFLKDLLSRPEAHIVNVASASAMIALPGATTYASSKWAVLGFTDSLREELSLAGESHVTVTSICPSYIGTGMFRGVKTPLLVPMMTPEAIARDIVRCVLRRQDQLLSPFLVKLLPLTKATWPRAAFRWLLRRLGISSGMRTWQGRRKSTIRPTAHSRRPFDLH